LNKKKDIQLNVLHYKNGDSFPDLSGYRHIWAGKAGKKEPSLLTGDDTGEHISDKNPYYSELTAIYWIWKNITADIIGTCHYRRFYTTHPEPFIYKMKRSLYLVLGLYRKRNGLIYTSNINYWKDKIIQQEQIDELLKEYDAILPQHRTLKYTVEEHFKRYHNQTDLSLLQTIIEELHPEYMGSFIKMLTQKSLYANNMFIVRKDEFDLLCTWLFSILFEFEKRIDLKDYTGYQERLFGFLSERLITTWFVHQELNTIELPLIYFKHFKQK
jgi:hypothetical protein